VRRTDPLALAAAALVVLGLAVLLVGLADGVPLVFWGTEEEHASREAGRRLIALAAVVLGVSGALLAGSRRSRRGVAVAAPGIAALGLALAFPWAAWPWLAFLLLGPVALGAAITAGRPARRYNPPSAGP
jgi:hypothetical protein